MAVPATTDEFVDLVRRAAWRIEKARRLPAETCAELPADAPKTAGLLVHNGILTNFQAENILAGKWRRFSIGKYKVLERLGSGGFAQVYLCEHKLMRRRVAVKVLPVAKTKDSSALGRFYREARAAAALDHPNIVHAYDIDQDEDLHFLVMEYVDGTNLQEIVKRAGPLDALRACHYIHDAAVALQHAHEHGLVHRDIKPGNILVDRSGVVKVLDMGLALNFSEEDDQLTKKHDDGTLGTADYLSPEQAMDSHDVDIRTDIYSLGVTFYFILTGRAPFEGLQMAEKLLAHQVKQPKPVSDYRTDVPAEVLEILDKMMAKKANQRYETPGELADALAPFTQVPIEPPAEMEMPRLSPAATGVPNSTAETLSGKHDTPVTPTRTRTQSGSSYVKKGKTTPAVKTPPAPPSQPEIAPWEQQYTEENPEFPAIDAAAPATAKSKPKLGKADTCNPIVLIALIGAFIVIPVFLIAVIFGAIWLFFPTPAPLAKVGPPWIEVSRDPNKKTAYRSIKSALQNAETGSVIELWDETYEEEVVVEPARGRTGVTLQAAPGKEIVCASRRNDPETPILMLSNAENFKLHGTGITFDGSLKGNRNVTHLLMITETSPGLIVEDVRFKNYAKSAIFVINAAGADENPIKLNRLIFDAGAMGSAAIYFDANPKMSPAVNDNILIDAPDFRGADLLKAIQFKDEKVLGNNVHWQGR